MSHIVVCYAGRHTGFTILRTWSAGGSVEPCSQPWKGSSKTIQVPSSSRYKNTRDKIHCTGVGALQVQRQKYHLQEYNCKFHAIKLNFKKLRVVQSLEDNEKNCED